MAQADVTKRRKEEFLPFLTAWDPSDLPGGSVDPLGFDRGYNALADKILPGLTNVAALPRYFGVICAGASLGPDATSPSQTEVQSRQDCVLRLERFWALALVLAAESGGPSASGVRGVTYAESQRDELARNGRRSSGSDFKLLSRQVPYGVLGIYGNVTHGFRLMDRKTLGLSTGFGETLAEAFLEETQAPRSLRTAVQDADAEVGLEALRGWGLRAHLSGIIGSDEARILGGALQLDRVRARMATALQANRLRNDESELQRLERIGGKLGRVDQDLIEAIHAILEYEKCFAWTLLAFERILWRCGGGGAVSLIDLAADEVLQRCARSLPGSVTQFEKALEGAVAPEFNNDLERLRDVRAFLAELFQAAVTSGGLVERVLARHADVQRGKLDRGRSKLPWVELSEGNAVLTQARATQVRGEPRRPEDIPPHEYRTRSADALIQASGGRT